MHTKQHWSVILQVSEEFLFLFLIKNRLYWCSLLSERWILKCQKQIFLLVVLCKNLRLMCETWSIHCFSTLINADCECNNSEIIFAAVVAYFNISLLYLRWWMNDTVEQNYFKNFCKNLKYTKEILNQWMDYENI